MTSSHLELKKELASLRERSAEITAILRGIHGPNSAPVQRSEEVSAAIQRLQWVIEEPPSAAAQENERRKDALV
ncbi:MAG: hypothetical protein HYZ57_00085 [Acidobacteria bacterium]|nr:hypothetical protein [Acidobacteriota bacterium]MBI3278220.1 hypothetical protein [Acidobacteriota bacterium]